MKSLLELIDRFSRKKEWGFAIDCRTYMGINGYGVLNDWVVDIMQLNEFCVHCQVQQNHFGNHKWNGEWVNKYQGSGHNLEAAIKMALNAYEQGESK